MMNIWEQYGKAKGGKIGEEGGGGGGGGFGLAESRTLPKGQENYIHKMEF
jgi:hypothetical protein